MSLMSSIGKRLAYRNVCPSYAIMYRFHVNIDIFSCKEFDPQGSLDDVKKTFGLADVKMWTLERGIEYSDPRTAFSGMVGERVGIIASGGLSDG